MKIAVLGAGRMGQIRAQVLQECGAEISLFGRNTESVKNLANSLSVKSYGLSELNGFSFDAYVVATSTDSHLTYLNQIIPYGKSILCEKPISLEVSETKDVIKMSEKYGTAIQVGFQRRFDPAIIASKKLLDSGGVGTLYAMHMYAHDHTPATLEFLDGSGSIFKDLHVHDFDLIRWLTGSEIATVYATQAVREHQQYAKYGDADVSLISLTTESGVQIAITGTRHDPVGHDVRFEIFGSKDSLAVGLNSKTPLHNVLSDLKFSDKPYGGFLERFDEAFKEETREFFRFASGQIANPCPPSAALRALEVAEACERSIKSGSAIKI